MWHRCCDLGCRSDRQHQSNLPMRCHSFLNNSGLLNKLNQSRYWCCQICLVTYKPCTVPSLYGWIVVRMKRMIAYFPCHVDWSSDRVLNDGVTYKHNHSGIEIPQLCSSSLDVNITSIAWNVQHWSVTGATSTLSLHRVVVPGAWILVTADCHADVLKLITVNDSDRRPSRSAVVYYTWYVTVWVSFLRWAWHAIMQQMTVKPAPQPVR